MRREIADYFDLIYQFPTLLFSISTWIGCGHPIATSLPYCRSIRKTTTNIGLLVETGKSKNDQETVTSIDKNTQDTNDFVVALP